MTIEVVDRPELRVAAVRHVGSYAKISEAFVRLDQLARSSGLVNSDTKLIGIYYDDPDNTPEDKLRADAGVTVPPTTRLPAALSEVKIPGGKYARAVHRGPYTGLGVTWGKLRNEWLPKSGYQYGSGFTYELYRNTPMNAKPENLETELYLPLK